MAIQLTPQDAFTALAKRLNTPDPVTATFRMVGDGEMGITMYIEVDGKTQDFEFNLDRSGNWAATLNREI